jgi:hypothetical protein
LERHRVPQLTLGHVPDEVPYADTWIVNYLERLPLRMTYPDVIEHVRRILQTSPLSGKAKLVIDQTGVGRAVFDMFRKARLFPIGITITAGDSFSVEGYCYRVSKSLLASRLDAALHAGDLHVVPSLREAEVLKAELGDFRRRTTASGATQFVAREGRHDDLVLAVAIALWFARHMSGQVVGMGRITF